MPRRRPARALRLLRYYLRYDVLGLPVAWYLVAILLIWFADWVSGGRAWH